METKNRDHFTDSIEWSKELDHKSGDYFYHNTMTGETQWDEPSDWQTSSIAEDHKDGVWEEILDEVSGDTYFYNKSTGETQWEAPGL